MKNVETAHPPHAEGIVLAERARNIRAGLFSFGLGLLLFSIFRGPLIAMNLDGPAIIPAGSRLLALGLAISVVPLILNLLQRRYDLQAYINQLYIFLAIWLVFFSDWLCHSYNLFQGPAIRGEIICAAGLSFFVLHYAFLNFFRNFALIIPLVLCSIFLEHADGRLLLSDDHASVFYRLSLLKDNFPFIPFYNPQWNAGTDARDFFSTGILNFYFLFYPIIQLLPLEKTYNFMVIVVIILALPLSIYFSSKIAKADTLSASLAAILSCAPSILWFRWCLKYGAMGFITSLVILPLVFVSFAKLLENDEEINLCSAACLTLLTALMLFWSLTFVVFLPLVFFALYKRKIFFRKKYLKLILVAVFLICTSWVGIWLKAANVLKFVGHPVNAEETRSNSDSEKVASKKETKRHKPLFRKLKNAVIIKNLRNFAINSNPLVLLLGLPALFFLPTGRSRLLWLLTAFWLLVVGLFIAPIMPRFELERMLLVFTILMTIPTGMLLGAGLKKYSGQTVAVFPKLVLSLVSGFLLIGPATASAAFSNRTIDSYSLTDDLIWSLSKAIKKYSGEGRTLFSGFILHEWSGAHVAPLAKFSSKPLIASSPVHNTWWYTDVIPDYYRELGEDGIEQYLDYLNVTAVIAHENFWKQFFEKQQTRYKLVWQGGRFKMFSRLQYVHKYFLEGEGNLLEQTSNKVRLTLSSKEAVIKFRYFPFLQSSACKISAKSLPGNLDLIQLSECPLDSEIVISAKNPYRRLFED